jgi:choline kinase
LPHGSFSTIIMMPMPSLMTASPSSQDKATLIEHLERCTDYFERGIESAIAVDRLRVHAKDISGYFVVEVDFASDLERADAEVSGIVTSAA